MSRTKGAAPFYQTQYFNELNIRKSNEMLDTLARSDAVSLDTQPLRQHSMGCGRFRGHFHDEAEVIPGRPELVATQMHVECSDQE